MIRSKLFIKRDVGTQSVIVAVGEASRRFHGMITVNGTGAFIWDLLPAVDTEEEIVDKILEDYEVSREEAEADTVQDTR